LLARALQRHNGARLRSERLRRSKQLQDFFLLLQQPGLQLRRERAARGIAVQLAADGPDADIAATELGEKRRGVRSTTSSRPPAAAAWVGDVLRQDSASMASASLPIVGCSNRLRSDTLTPKVSRISTSAFIAINECAPRSNTSSSTPTASMPSSRAQIPASTVSVRVRGGAAA
jgi:hypothetical protein